MESLHHETNPEKMQENPLALGSSSLIMAMEQRLAWDGIIIFHEAFGANELGGKQESERNEACGKRRCSLWCCL